MKKITKLTFLLLLLLSYAGFATAKNSIDVENVSDTHIRISISIDSVAFEDVQKSSINFQTVKIPGLGAGTLNKPGTYATPVIAKMVGIPPRGDLSLSVATSHSYVLNDKNILYNPVLKDESGILKPDYSKINMSDNHKGDPSPPIVDKRLLGFAGDRNLASVRIFPVQYNYAQKTLQVFDRLIVDVKISGKTKTRNFAQANSYLDEIAPELIINNDVSKSWRKKREASLNQTKFRDEGTISNFKIYIKEKGIYKISYSYLKDTLSFWQDSLAEAYMMDFELDTINPKNIGLFHKDRPVPIYFFGEDDGSFDEGDYFEFYADINHGRDSFYDHYSLENCFVLKNLSAEKGARLAVEDGGLYETDPREYTEPFYYNYTAHFEEQNKFAYLSEYTGEREDYWFWLNKMAPSMSQVSLELHNPLQTNAREANVSVNLFGQSYRGDNNNGKHHVQAYINNSQVGFQKWTGQSRVEIAGALANENLDHGNNLLYLSMPDDQGATLDKILLDFVDVTYWREFIANENRLEFHKPSIYGAGLFQFKISGFDSSNIEVYKPGVSKFENLSIESSLPDGGAPFVLTFQDEIYDSDLEYIAVTEDEKLLPDRLTPQYPHNIKNRQNQADYILISPMDYLKEEKVDEFVAHWYNKANLTVKPVPLESIFDEFNGGIRSPYAIRDFLKYAYNNWQTPAPRYVLLLGDGCQDEREGSYTKEFSIIPVKFDWSYHVGATANDNWYACIVGDDELPDLILGRIPVWEKEQVAPVLEKTIHYNENPNYNDVWRNHVMPIAGGNHFLEQNERLFGKYISEDYRVTRIYPSLPSSDPYWGGTTDLKDNIDDGTAFIQFMGHGGGQIWSDLNIMDLPDIATLFNDNYPMISSLTCYTSNFASSSPKTTCLGEKFVIEPEKGAIGFFGSAGKGFLDQDEYFQDFVLNNISNRGMRNFALANNISKIEYSFTHGLGGISKTFLRAFNYMGDPAVNIAFPENKLQTDMNTHQFVKGDTAKFYLSNTEGNLDQVAYYVTDTDRLIPSPYDPDQMQQVELYNIEQKGYQSEAYEHVIDTTDTADQYERIIHTYAHNDTADYFGSTRFMVGNSIVFDTHTTPEIPLLGDSVKVKTKICHKEGVDSVQTLWWTSSDSTRTIAMQQVDTLEYETKHHIYAFETVKNVKYKVRWWDGNDQIHETETFEYELQGADLNILDFTQSANNGSPAYKVTVRNEGSAEFPPGDNSAPYKISILDGEVIISYIPTNKKIGLTETVDFYLPNDTPSGYYTLEAIVNSDTTYLEESYNNNSYPPKLFSINNHEINPDISYQIASLDSNARVILPTGSVSDEAYLFFNNIDSTIITEQPDIEQVALKTGDVVNYELACYDSTALSGGDEFYENTELVFAYSQSDSTVQAAAEAGELYIYLFDSRYEQWVQKGGLVNLETSEINYPFIKKTGIYSLFHNKDKTVPEIKANVEGQEFTDGEYVDKQATFSIIIQDRNGVNPESIEMLLDGSQIENYTISLEDINSIPLQYQIDVEKGTHSFLVSAQDNNGNYKEEVINFSVQEEFKILHIGNYPNPISSKTSDPNNEGRTRFTYTLTTAADDIKIKVYTVSGRLVNEIADLSTSCGYHEYPRSQKGWNCIDFDDRKLANGVYFYKIIATKGDKTIEKIEKMAILK